MELTKLPIGREARVKDLTASGLKRRRLLDLGLIPGTSIIVRRNSPAGDPRAYLVRGTLLALRKEETDLVEVS
ncbi:MAG: FeoA family protein [Halanaerobium sp.]|nr:FeoA family protein [Halanaerobium sp.]